MQWRVFYLQDNNYHASKYPKLLRLYFQILPLRFVFIFIQEGYKEGISDGRETEFQSGFDLGFTDGLRGGFVLGQLMAIKELHPDSTPLITAIPKLPCESCRSGLDTTSTLQKISSINQTSAAVLENQSQSLIPNKPNPNAYK